MFYRRLVFGRFHGVYKSAKAVLTASAFLFTIIGCSEAELSSPGQIDPNPAPEPGPVFDPPDPPTKGPLVAELRLLTYNVYGLDEDKCETRAERFGNIVSVAGTVTGQPFDIVGLQEYYEDHFLDFGTICDHDKLKDAAQSSGRYLNSDNTKFFRPVANNQHNGGVGVMTLHKIVAFDDWQWDSDTQGWPKAAEGFVFARIDIPGRGLTLDIYVVHLNSGNTHGSARKAQLIQLADRIREFSRTSGNPVFVMGDFNVGGPNPQVNPPGNSGYEDIIDILGAPRDLWLSANALADPSEGYTTGCGLFASDPNGCLGKERIDYIFHVTDPDLTNNQLQVWIGDAGVSRVRWASPVQVTSVPIHYVSDHFGVDATIEIRQRP